MTVAGARHTGSALGLALPAASLAAGCGGPGPDGGAARTAPGANSPSPTATPPAELCAHVIAYWSRRTLTGDTCGDHQSMGLSDGQYGILRTVVHAARAERRRTDAACADRLTERRSRESCAKRYRNGAPTGGPWG